MKKRTSLKVQPLRRYKKPIYPSHRDKNPIDHPETLPYPFSHKAINALLAAGILVGVPFLSSDAMPSSNQFQNLPSIEQDSLVNPFPFESLGVPFIPPSYGTGLPSRLSSEEARKVIDRVFLEEGLELQENYAYDKDGVKVLLSGYDPECQIGYVWVDYYNMGEGMTRSYREWRDDKASDNPESLAKRNRQKIKTTIRSITYELEERTGRRYDKQVFIDRFEKAKLIGNEKEKMEALELIKIDLHIENLKYKKDRSQYQFFKKHLKGESLAEKETVLNNWQSQRNVLDTVKRLKRYKIENGKQLSEKIERFGFELLENKDEAIKKEELGIYRTFLWSYSRLKYAPLPEELEEKYKAVLQSESKADFMKGANEFLQFVEDRKLSLEESKALADLGEDENDFIAPIGQRDGRFSYSSRIYTYDEEELKKLKKQLDNQTISKKEFGAALQKLKEEARDIPKIEKLKSLENQVRQYIQWAKQQGRH